MDDLQGRASVGQLVNVVKRIDLIAHMG